MAMIDAYRIAVELVMGGDLAAGIDALIPQLSILNDSLAKANTEAKGLAAGLRGVGNSAAGIGRAAAELDKLHAAMSNVNRAVEEHRVAGGMPEFTVPSGGGPRVGAAEHPLSMALLPSAAPNFTLPPPGIGPQADASFFAEGEGRSRIPLYPNGRGGRAAGERGGGGHAAGPFDAVIPGLLTGEAIKSVFDASFDVGAKESAMLANGWSQEKVAQVRALAQQIQVATPGATIGGALEIAKDLGALLRDRDGAPETGAAMDALPALARDMVVLGARGHGDGVAEIFKAAQAGDLRGVITKPGTDEIDPQALVDFIHKTTLADVVTGGRVTPGMMLQFSRTGGATAAMMSDSELFGANLALIEGLGPQAATALSGFNRQFGAGRMGKGVAKELEGVFPNLHGHWHSVGMGQVMVDPGAMGDPLAAAKNPLAFIHDTLKPGIDQLLSQRIPGFDAMAPNDKMVMESQEASRISAGVSGSKAIAETLRIFSIMQRDTAAFVATAKTDPYATTVANNPQTQVKALGAAMNAFEVSLGEAAQGPAIAALNALTGALNNMAAWAKANPEGSKTAMEGLALGLLALGAAPVKAALASMSAAGGKGSLYAMAGGILALSGALDKFPSWLVDVIKGAAAGGAVAGAPGAAAGAAGHLLWNRGPSGDFWNDPHWVEKRLGLMPSTQAPAPANDASALPGGGRYAPLAYHPTAPAAAPVVQHISYIQLDGRTVARSVTNHQLRMMGGQVSGTLRPDPSINPHYGAHLLET